MKLWIWTLLIIFCSVISPHEVVFAKTEYQFQMSDDWKQWSNVKGVETWRKRGTGEIVTIVAHEVDKTFSFVNAPNRNVAGLLEEIRNSVLNRFGIKAWTIQGFEKNKVSNKTTLFKIAGHYTGVENQLVRFIEWQYYSGKKFYQITYSSEKSVPEQKTVQNIFGRFRPQGL